MDTHAIANTSGFEKIVVPLDGSSLSECALPVATAIARASRATVYLARVHTPIIATMDISLPVLDWEDEIRASEQAYLSAVARMLSKEDVQVEVRPLDGSVGRAIKDLVESVGANLVVITTHGRTGLSRTWLGSTADWLVRFAPAPVLMVRPPEEPAAREISLKHVLIALDGSERAERIIPEAIRLGRLVGARFTLVRVVQPIIRSLAAVGTPALAQVPDEERTSEIVRRTKDYLDGVAETFRREIGGLEVTTEAVASDRTADAILECARRGGAEIIALATRGRGASRLLVGSVADKVLRGFTGAVLALGPAAVREQMTDEVVIEPESTVERRAHVEHGFGSG
ncbi:MAG TPA: universal stress protein [Gemmatimonadaceae bacterium]